MATIRIQIPQAAFQDFLETVTDQGGFYAVAGEPDVAVKREAFLQNMVRDWLEEQFFHGKSGRQAVTLRQQVRGLGIAVSTLKQ